MTATLEQQNEKLDNTTDPEALRIIANRLSRFLSEARSVGAQYTGARQQEIELSRLRQDVSCFADSLRTFAHRDLAEST